MVQKTMSMRLVKYLAVGIIPFGANLAMFSLLTYAHINVGFATGVAFIVGGQVAFWSHDRLTFGDRHVSLRGWQRRWRRFMPGQVAGFALNYAAANMLVEFTQMPALAIWALAMTAGVTGTFSWTNWFSHKDATVCYPAPSAKEDSHV